MFNIKECKSFLTNIIELEDFDNSFGDLMTINDFIKDVETKRIMDYDGCSDIIYKNKSIKNAILDVDEQIVYFYDDRYDDYVIGITLYMLRDIFGKDIKIAWYNK